MHVGKTIFFIFPLFRGQCGLGASESLWLNAMSYHYIPENKTNSSLASVQCRFTRGLDRVGWFSRGQENPTRGAVQPAGCGGARFT